MILGLVPFHALVVTWLCSSCSSRYFQNWNRSPLTLCSFLASFVNQVKFEEKCSIVDYNWSDTGSCSICNFFVVSRNVSNSCYLRISFSSLLTVRSFLFIVGVVCGSLYSVAKLWFKMTSFSNSDWWRLWMRNCD